MDSSRAARGRPSRGREYYSRKYVLRAHWSPSREVPDIAITLLIGDSRAVGDWVAEGRAEIAWSVPASHRGVEYAS